MNFYIKTENISLNDAIKLKEDGLIIGLDPIEKHRINATILTLKPDIKLIPQHLHKFLIK